MSLRYALNTYILPKSGRDEVNMEKARIFYSTVQDYIGAFLNTTGGVLHFGVTPSGRVVGVSCTRAEEDAYKLTVDNIVKLFQPKVSPSLYRLDFVPITSSTTKYDDWKVISLHVSAGPEILYMDGSERVMVKVDEGVYGPLYPQELQRLAIHKYKQEILNAEILLKVITPFPKSRHTKKLDERPRSPSKRPRSPSKIPTSPSKKHRSPSKIPTSPSKKHRSRSKKHETACTMSQTTPGLINNACACTSDDNPEGVASSSQESPANCSRSIIIIDSDSDLQCFGDLESTIITIRDSSDSDSDSSLAAPDQTVTSTPICSSSDLFASPGCSTVKKVTRARPALSPIRYPGKFNK